MAGRGDLTRRGGSQCSVREEGVVGVTLHKTESFLLCGVFTRALDVVGGAAAGSHAGAGGGRERGFVVVAGGGRFAEDVGEGELAAVAVRWRVRGEGGVGGFVGEGLRAG